MEAKEMKSLPKLKFLKLIFLFGGVLSLLQNKKILPMSFVSI